MNITIVDKDSIICDIYQYLCNETILALDCEGVDLGRTGEICIIQISTRDRCFLFDVHELTSNCCEMIDVLKNILEDISIVKIIHDCRMDSDALYHLLGIRLVNVHDTQAWDYAIRGVKVSLNNLLSNYDLPQNNERDSNVYVENLRFWATRPLTRKMITWASGDVENLFQIHDRQNCDASSSQRLEASSISEEYVNAVRECLVASVQLHETQIGRFIGPKGKNIRALTEKVPECHLKFRTLGKGGASNTVIVYAPNEKSMNKVRRLLRPFQQKKR
mmetsp:Transcript_7188/g.10686  ORF Transcript_7188/g.10686 Transcript_7188/m.10686 type:complete len:276 (-) Transcript_7188:249-1076(-)